MESRGAKFGRFLLWVLESFGSLIAFYVVERVYGLLPALIVGVALGIVFVVLQIVREKHVSSLTAFSAGMVLVFGVLDLYFQSGFFVKIEPAIGNAISGLFFAWSVWRGNALITELVVKQRPTLPERVRGYLDKLTLAWAIFFFLRAAGYAWMAFTLPLDQALVIRGTVGPLSYGAMFVGEFAFRYLKYGRRAFRRED